MKIKRNWWTYIFVSIAGAASCAALGYGVYSVIQKQKPKTFNLSNVSPTNWSEYGNNLQEFSQNNSFRVNFVVDLKLNSCTTVQGTAWTFYLDQDDENSIKWYLLTNFHVVNQAVNYNGGSDGASSKMLYQHVTEINYGFSLDRNIDNKYYSIISKNWPRGFQIKPVSSTDSLTLASSDVLSVKVITDNAREYNNGDDLDLFSNSTTNKSNYYNLDVSMIKIEISKTALNSERTTFFSDKLINPYNTYKQNDYIALSYNSSFNTFIAGNPASSGTLVPQIVNPNDNYFVLNSYEDYYSNISTNAEPLNVNLQKLYFHSYASRKYYSNWPLTSGASGSAIYQFDGSANSVDEYNLLNLNQIMPIGIYWGGTSLTSNGYFQPCFIPLVDSRYNIYANFTKFLSSSYNK